MDVLEISPGGGWYTEVLAQYLKGDLLAAHYDPSSERSYYRNSQNRFATKMASDPELYGNVKIQIFDAAAKKLTTEDESVDAAVTFRNVHNRAPEGTDRAKMRKSGYMTQNYVVELAQRAGFVFEESSEVNANEKDTADYSGGVWTLPPSLRLGDEDRERYLAIGESDRMTLRFRKPQE